MFEIGDLVRLKFNLKKINYNNIITVNEHIYGIITNVFIPCDPFKRGTINDNMYEVFSSGCYVTVYGNDIVGE
jgi:hypothetical protein